MEKFGRGCLKGTSLMLILGLFRKCKIEAFDAKNATAGYVNANGDVLACLSLYFVTPMACLRKNALLRCSNSGRVATQAKRHAIGRPAPFRIESGDHLPQLPGRQGAMTGARHIRANPAQMAQECPPAAING